MSPVSIVIVPGLWEGPTVFDPLRAILSANGVDSYVAPLRSTGTTSPGNPSMEDDIAGVRAVLTDLVQTQGKRLLVVGHSAGGFISAGATKDLEAKDANSPGVVGFYFICAGLLPVGHTQPDLPFMNFQGDRMFCHDPEKLVFNDVPAELTAKYLPGMQCQPSQGYNSPIDYAGWEHVPSTYLKCTKDALLLPEIQDQIAAAANVKVDEVDLGHLPFLSGPQQVADKLLAAIEQ